MSAALESDLERPWYDFEKNYDHVKYNNWMLQNRYWSIILGLIYLVLLYVGRKWMESRKPYSLRTWLAAWNLLMSTLSIAVLVRIGPYFLKRTASIPFFGQMCTNEYDHSPTIMFWLDFFVITKPIEFIDTLFIVFRKQHLHFLHYYHHVTVVILCWYSLGVAPIPPNSIYYVAMNSFVHSVMYTYYLLRSMKISVPRIGQMTITIFQIIQMVVGVVINVAPLVYRLGGASKCDAAFESIYLALAIYFSYFVLFANFFYKTYFARKKSVVQKSD